MIQKPSDNSKKIAELIVDNARFIKDQFNEPFVSTDIINGYIEMLEKLISINDTFYRKMQLKDDYTFEAVTNKAKSFIRIYKDTEVFERNREKIDAAFNRLNDSYLEMLDRKPYFIDTDISKINF